MGACWQRVSHIEEWKTDHIEKIIALQKQICDLVLVMAKMQPHVH